MKTLMILSILLLSLWTNVIAPVYLMVKSGMSKKYLLLYLIGIPDIIVLYYSIQFIINNT